MRFELTPLRVIAAKEFQDRLRNRWVLVIGVVLPPLPC